MLWRLVLWLVYHSLFITNRIKNLKSEKLYRKTARKNDPDSINYASKIQESILLPEEEIRRYLSDFLFLSLKILLAETFIGFGIVNDIKIIAAIDCTVLGVPGAFMSMIANATK